MADEVQAVVEKVELTDVQKIDAEVAKLEQDGQELFADAIQLLKDKKTELVAKAEKEAQTAATMGKIAEQTLVQKYGGKAWELAKAAGIAAIICRLFFF